MVENVLQYVQACAQEDKVLQSLEESSTTDDPKETFRDQTDVQWEF